MSDQAAARGRRRGVIVERLIFLVLVFAAACSGPEQEPDPPPGEAEPVQTEPVDEDPPPVVEPAEDDGEMCSTDADCEMFTPCCACPRIPQAMHRVEAAAEHDRCTRVRCAVCAEEPPPGPPQVARCVDDRCVAVDGPAAGPRCERDDECAIHAPCCV